MNEHGFAFSFDLLAAFLIMCMMLYLMLLSINGVVADSRAHLEKFSWVRKGIFLLDSLVKNHNPDNPITGAAYFSPEKRRAENNIIDYALIKSAGEGIAGLNGGDSIKELAVVTKAGTKETVYSSKIGEECLALERFVIIKRALLEEKGKIVLVVCNAQ